jgi:hypothetical protein
VAGSHGRWHAKDGTVNHSDKPTYNADEIFPSKLTTNRWRSESAVCQKMEKSYKIVEQTSMMAIAQFGQKHRGRM